MKQTWEAGTPLDLPKPRGLRDWLRILRRGLPMAFFVFGGALLLVLLRLIESPIHGMHRPWTPYITRFACQRALACLGLSVTRHGQIAQERGAVVANHSSWLDIFALNAGDLVYFVSKAEVSGWPGIGWLARITGTVFIARDPRQARAQTELFEARLLAGHRLMFFPEGTSTDNQRVLPFKTTLFAAFRSEALKDVLSVQPVTLRYVAPPGTEARFYGWWGEMDFGSNLLAMLTQKRHGRIEVHYHPPLRVADFSDRKALAAAAEAAVRDGLFPEGEAQAG